jgi:hypothetical protein
MKELDRRVGWIGLALVAGWLLLTWVWPRFHQQIVDQHGQ